MTPQEHEDGMRPEPTLSAAEKADGFAAVMKRLKSHNPDERARLETQADEVVLGHEAYALGQEYLDRGNYEAARRWLRMAVGHHIPGAAQALEEIALRQAFDGFTDVATVGGDHAAAGTVSCETIPSPHGPRAKDGQHRLGGLAWTSFVEQFYPDQTVAAVRAQARREADAILTEARQQADQTAAACAEMMLNIEKERKQAAELLAEARQEAESVRSQVAEIAEEARRSTDEMLAKAQRHALLILDEAREEAAQIRSRARRQNRAGSQTRGYPSRKHWASLLTECAVEPSWDYLVAPGWHATDGLAHNLPVPTRPEQGALERVWQAPLSFTGNVLLLKCGADSGIRQWVQAPQEGDEQGGAGPESWNVAWQVLIEAGLCQTISTALERVHHRRGDITDVVRQNRLRVLALGVVRTDGEDTDDDAELGVEGVGNSAS